MLITQALRQGNTGGQPLPSVWPGLSALGGDIRSAELTVVAGQPGAGKSAFALATAVKLRVPTLYFCADSADWTMAVRLGAMLSGQTQDEVEANLMRDPRWGVEEFYSQATHVRWCFDGAPSLDDIDLEVAAYEEMFGVNPQLIVIDNLIDVADGEDEWGALRRCLKELKFLARDTNAAVVVLHHASEAVPIAENAAPPRSAILGRDSRLPALVLTIASDPRGFLAVAPVKNRYGKADPSGTTCIWLGFDGARMRVYELRGGA
jgi:replicative DNA helicase